MKAPQIVLLTIAGLSVLVACLGLGWYQAMPDDRVHMLMKESSRSESFVQGRSPDLATQGMQTEGRNNSSITGRMAESQKVFTPTTVAEAEGQPAPGIENNVHASSNAEGKFFSSSHQIAVSPLAPLSDAPSPPMNDEVRLETVGQVPMSFLTGNDAAGLVTDEGGQRMLGGGAGSAVPESGTPEAVLDQVRMQFEDQVAASGVSPESPAYRWLWQRAQRDNDEIFSSVYGGDPFIRLQLEKAQAEYSSKNRQ